MATSRYRVVDTSGSEACFVELDSGEAIEGASVGLPDGAQAEIVEVYDDDDGREGGVSATLVVDAQPAASRIELPRSTYGISLDDSARLPICWLPRERRLGVRRAR